jgi:hypothetical protein
LDTLNTSFEGSDNNIQLREKLESFIKKSWTVTQENIVHMYKSVFRVTFLYWNSTLRIISWYTNRKLVMD